ncbi:hypothetical protein PS862_03208 [Pseudomonas fluorescens]|uniref:Uncharacterized protein n=1 Tax=Pseudomonas fluorescens TaxID=294 RepID=A0A5E7L1P2_PSEFL|nr:hypothetical protein [Pseudomonas fluorescens]VVM90588.1 hypothetical protein PS639_02758 [Pseudomonas fluorescens]VVP08070.1 hypothetical protein PS862_03208 [Pseudomonas fluorescens]
MNKTDLTLAFALCLTATAAAHADDLTPTTDYSSEFNYYGENQPFAHPVPPSLSSVPPRSYIPTAPREFIPIASQHVFHDSRLPTVADATVRVFIRSYDAERGVYVNEEVPDPSCLLACLGGQGQASEVYH